MPELSGREGLGGLVIRVPRIGEETEYGKEGGIGFERVKKDE